jgi:hypothetical protein
MSAMCGTRRPTLLKSSRSISMWASQAIARRCSPAGAVLVPRSERVEELLGHVLVAQTAGSQTARVEVATLGERDVLVDDALQILGLRQGRHDLLVADE